jgi:hypothetical protein
VISLKRSRLCLVTAGRIRTKLRRRARRCGRPKASLVYSSMHTTLRLVAKPRAALDTLGCGVTVGGSGSRSCR